MEDITFLFPSYVLEEQSNLCNVVVLGGLICFLFDWVLMEVYDIVCFSYFISSKQILLSEERRMLTLIL